MEKNDVFYNLRHLRDHQQITFEFLDRKCLLIFPPFPTPPLTDHISISKFCQIFKPYKMQSLNPSTNQNHRKFYLNCQIICDIIFSTHPGFYPSTFGCSRFSPKLQFLQCLLGSLSLNLGVQFTGKCISNTFSDCRSIACTSFVWSNSCIEFYWEIQRNID